ncbi:MAG: septal ring lytic transglycosylase RlpA family protein [Thermodesulfobacteriota bacterium]
MRGYLLLLSLLILTACAHGGHESGKPYRGIASWYGPNFNGKLTASGEVYDMNALTAAHKTLPLGTIVDVKNLENGRTVRLTINDRGPFVRGRIIDLSYRGARVLGVVKKGTARVSVTPVGRDNRYIKYIRVSDKGSGEYTVQIGAFTNRENARRLLRALGVELSGAYISEAEVSGRLFYRVRAGDFASRDEALKAAKDLAYEGYEAVLLRK